MGNIDQKDRKTVTILGTRVNSTSEEEVLKAIGHHLEEKTKFSLVTPNPEIVLQADEDEKLQEAINTATFSIPDGFGLKLADFSLKIIHGRKLFLKVCELVNERKGKIYLLGGGLVTGTAEKAKAALEKEFTNVAFRAADGPMLNRDANPIDQENKNLEAGVVAEISQFKPDILFIAFGAPKQEKWMAKWLSRLQVGGAMCIGGTLDYLAGTVSTPPVWLEKLELEWLWRLLTQKNRFRRVLDAVFIFPLKLFFDRIRG